MNLECRLTQSIELGQYILLIGEIVELHVDADCMTEGKMDPSKIDPLIYAPGILNYYSLGKIVAKAFSVGKKTGESKHNS